MPTPAEGDSAEAAVPPEDAAERRPLVGSDETRPAAPAEQRLSLRGAAAARVR
eukprot:COSAG04_NODE_19143_length_423_cov_1.277778_1_plen_52_part_01